MSPEIIGEYGQRIEVNADQLVNMYLECEDETEKSLLGRTIMCEVLDRTGFMELKTDEEIVRYLDIAHRHPGAEDMILDFLTLPSDDPDYPATKTTITQYLQRFSKN